MVRMHATPTPHTYYTHTWTQRSYVPLMRKSVQHGTDAFQIVKDFQGHTILASVVCIYAYFISKVHNVTKHNRDTKKSMFKDINNC